jgi:hypothetical protein
MDERERLTKAHQSAQQLLSDLREVQAKTDDLAIEELMLIGLEDVAKISRWLGRLSTTTQISLANRKHFGG